MRGSARPPPQETAPQGAQRRLGCQPQGTAGSGRALTDTLACGNMRCVSWGWQGPTQGHPATHGSVASRDLHPRCRIFGLCGHGESAQRTQPPLAEGEQTHPVHSPSRPLASGPRSRPRQEWAGLLQRRPRSPVGSAHGQDLHGQRPEPPALTGAPTVHPSDVFLHLLSPRAPITRRWAGC